MKNVVFACLPKRFHNVKQGVVFTAFLYRLVGDAVFRFDDDYEFRVDAVDLWRRFDFSVIGNGVGDGGIGSRLDVIEKLLRRIDENTSGSVVGLGSVELLCSLLLLDSHGDLGSVQLTRCGDVPFDDKRVRGLKDSARVVARRLFDAEREACFSAGKSVVETQSDMDLGVGE